jgi:hypothetical protein
MVQYVDQMFSYLDHKKSIHAASSADRSAGIFPGAECDAVALVGGVGAIEGCGAGLLSQRRLRQISTRPALDALRQSSQNP